VYRNNREATREAITNGHTGRPTVTRCRDPRSVSNPFFTPATGGA